MGIIDAIGTVCNIIETGAGVVQDVAGFVGGLFNGPSDSVIAPPPGIISVLPNLRTGGISSSPLDGDVNEKEASQVQILGNSQGISREQVVKALLVNQSLRNAVLMNSMANIKTQQIQLTMTSTYAFSHLTREELDHEQGLCSDIAYIGVDEHAYNHIVPNLFTNWEKLLQWQFFYVGSIRVKVSINTPDTTSTQVVYFPMGMDTIDMDNEAVLTAYNKSDQVKGEGLEYLITNFSPMKYVLQENHHIVMEDYMLRPNMPIVSQSLKQYEQGKVGSKPLLFGTFCLLKKNYSEQDVVVTVDFIMNCSVFNQSGVYNMKSGSDSVPPQNAPKKVHGITAQKKK